MPTGLASFMAREAKKVPEAEKAKGYKDTPLTGCIPLHSHWGEGMQGTVFVRNNVGVVLAKECNNVRL